MDWTPRTRLGLTAAVALMVAGVAVVAAQRDSSSLGTVRLPRAVVADGKPLPAGTYTLRLSADPVTAVVGQSADSERWVEFLQAGQVKGRELASVVTGPDVAVVAKRTPPTSGRPLVQMLRGADYLRVWVNSAGTQYLIHLALPTT
jgi:hypothetical protein